MREASIVLEGKIKNFARSEAGNLAFMLEDSGGIVRYCYSPVKDVVLNVSDDLLVFGTRQSANKIRVNYILNKTRNTETTLIDKKQSWAYGLSLALSIIVTGLFVVALLVLLRIFPISYSSSFDSIFGFVISLIMVIMFFPLLIILWVLTSAFSKKRSESEELVKRVKDVREDLGISGSSKPSTQHNKASDQSESDFTGTAKFCSHCGEKLPLEAKFCAKCGAKWE